MKARNVEMLTWENEELWDLLENLMERIKEFREEMAAGLDDLEDKVEVANNKKPLLK